MNFLRTTVFAAATACLAAGASAQSATSYSLGWYQNSQQDDATHKHGSEASLTLQINGVDTSQFDSGYVEVQKANPFDGAYTQNVWLDSNFKFVEKHSHFGASVGNMRGGGDNEYWYGDYVYHLQSGGVDMDFGVISDNSNLGSAPLLTQYDALQNLTAGQAFNVNVPGFTPSGGAGGAHTSYTIRDLGDDSLLLSGMSTDASAFSFNIPGGALLGNHNYALQVVYSSFTVTPNAGFGGATSYLSYDNAVTVNFSVPQAVPEPSAMAGLGLGALALLRRRKK